MYLYGRKKKATTASPKIDFVLTSFQTKVFRALKQCVSGRVPSWSSRCCSSRPTGCVVALRSFGFVLRDLPKPRRQPFRVQVRCIFPSYPLFCAQEQSCDFRWCGQEEGEVARNLATWRFFWQLRLRYVSGKVVTSTAVHGVRSRACGCSSGQRRPLCRGLLRDGGEFDLPLLCVLVH